MPDPNQPQINPSTEDLVKAKVGNAAAARVAEQAGTTPQDVEGARRATAEAAGRLMGTRIVDNSTELLAAERGQDAEYWRSIADDPSATDTQRSDALREAAGVQAEADNLAGVTDPSIRPGGHQPLSGEEIAASRAKVMRMHRI